jgi:hypothetical protein
MKFSATDPISLKTTKVKICPESQITESYNAEVEKYFNTLGEGALI